MSSTLSAEQAAAISRHMNEDHADAVVAYARVYGHIAEVKAATITAFDANAMELSVDTGADHILSRIPFDHVLADTDDARQTLIVMAKAAAAEK